MHSSGDRAIGRWHRREGAYASRLESRLRKCTQHDRRAWSLELDPGVHKATPNAPSHCCIRERRRASGLPLSSNARSNGWSRLFMDENERRARRKTGSRLVRSYEVCGGRAVKQTCAVRAGCSATWVNARTGGIFSVVYRDHLRIE